MTEKTKLILVAAVTLCAVGTFAVTLVHAVWYAPEESTHSIIAIPHPATALPEDPLRLSIPSLHISAAVQYVGVNAKGNMGVPSNFTDVAWYKDGPAPGQVGSAVIDGHVDNGLGLDGVFKHLGDIRVGDELTIETKEHSTLRFKVVDIETYPYTQVPLQTLFGRNDAVRLNLVTCEGVWVPGDKTYDHRLVVYTQLES